MIVLDCLQLYLYTKILQIIAKTKFLDNNVAYIQIKLAKREREREESE